MSMNRHQSGPRGNASRPIWELVIEDMRERDRAGRKTYGMPLQANNGRDALLDACQEALDLAACLRQEIAERDQEDILNLAVKEPDTQELKERASKALRARSMPVAAHGVEWDLTLESELEDWFDEPEIGDILDGLADSVVEVLTDTEKDGAA